MRRKCRNNDFLFIVESSAEKTPSGLPQRPKSCRSIGDAHNFFEDADNGKSSLYDNSRLQRGQQITLEPSRAVPSRAEHRVPRNSYIIYIHTCIRVSMGICTSHPGENINTRDRYKMWCQEVRSVALTIHSVYVLVPLLVTLLVQQHYPYIYTLS